MVPDFSNKFKLVEEIVKMEKAPLNFAPEM